VCPPPSPKTQQQRISLLEFDQRPPAIPTVLAKLAKTPSGVSALNSHTWDTWVHSQYSWSDCMPPPVQQGSPLPPPQKIYSDLARARQWCWTISARCCKELNNNMWKLREGLKGLECSGLCYDKLVDPHTF